MSWLGVLRSCSSCWIPPQTIPQLQGPRGLVRVKSQFGAHCPQQCWNQLELGLWQGTGIPCCRVVQPCRRQAWLQEGLGKPVHPGCANPACPPAQQLAGPGQVQGQEESVVSVRSEGAGPSPNPRGCQAKVVLEAAGAAQHLPRQPI